MAASKPTPLSSRGLMGAVNAYVTNTTDIVVDIDGYFAPVSTQTLAFYPLLPAAWRIRGTILIPEV